MERAITEEEFEKLVERFGDACFDCGEWDEAEEYEIPYDTILEESQSAKRQILAAYRELQQQLIELRKDHFLALNSWKHTEQQLTKLRDAQKESE